MARRHCPITLHQHLARRCQRPSFHRRCSRASLRWILILIVTVLPASSFYTNIMSSSEKSAKRQKTDQPLSSSTKKTPTAHDSPVSSAKSEDAHPDSISLDQLSLVSFNVAGCQPSAVAPVDWTQQDSIMAIKREVLMSQKKGTAPLPDIIALQELPGILVHNRGRMESLFPQYNMMGVRQSHADYVALLVRKGIASKTVNLRTNDDNDLPAVVAELTSPVAADNDDDDGVAPSSRPRRVIWIASVHLEPFGSGSSQRKEQMETILEKASAAGVSALLVAGDTNMRVAEDSAMENSRPNGLGYQDVWKLAGSDMKTKYTWNTRNNLSRGGYFNEYYGHDTREYIARYDRIYFKTLVIDADQASVGSRGIQVKSFDLIANQPVGSSRRHFLSDHFGMSTSFRVLWKEEEEEVEP